MRGGRARAAACCRTPLYLVEAVLLHDLVEYGVHAVEVAHGLLGGDAGGQRGEADWG